MFFATPLRPLGSLVLGNAADRDREGGRVPFGSDDSDGPCVAPQLTYHVDSGRRSLKTSHHWLSSTIEAIERDHPVPEPRPPPAPPVNPPPRGGSRQVVSPVVNSSRHEEEISQLTRCRPSEQVMLVPAARSGSPLLSISPEGMGAPSAIEEDRISPQPHSPHSPLLLHSPLPMENALHVTAAEELAMLQSTDRANLEVGREMARREQAQLELAHLELERRDMAVAEMALSQAQTEQAMLLDESIRRRQLSAEERAVLSSDELLPLWVTHETRGKAAIQRRAAPALNQREGFGHGTAARQWNYIETP